MDRHLPVLHEVMCQGLRDDNIESVEKYIEDITRVVISYEIYQTSLRRV